MNRPISDHSLPPLEPDLVGWEPVVGAIRKQIAQKREEQTMQQSVLDFTAARAERDAGMNRAHDAAARRDEDWPELAYGFLVRYARTHATFEGWQVTAEAERLGYAAPGTQRAWGRIYVRAMEDGVIVIDGVGRNPQRHNSICPRYRSTVFGGTAA